VDYLLKPFDKKRVALAYRRPRPAGSGGIASRENRRLDAYAAGAKTANLENPTQAVGRMFLVDQREICYASIEDGVITVVTAGPSGMEGHSNCRTLEELLASLDPGLFWRAHRSYLVNINRIREVVPWFKSSYQLRMDDKKQSEIPVSRLRRSDCASFSGCEFGAPRLRFSGPLSQLSSPGVHLRCRLGGRTLA